jgi:hypothetical protein
MGDIKKSWKNDANPKELYEASGAPVHLHGNLRGEESSKTKRRTSFAEPVACNSDLSGEAEH